MLTDIANYIQRKKQVSLSELSVVFGVAKEVIEPMLQHYVAKGWLLLHHGNPCAGCQANCASCEVPLWCEWCKT